MPFTLSGKTVLITGANRGIGLGFVTTLLEAGVSRIYATARQAEGLQQLADMNADIIRALPLDLNDTASIQALAGQIESLDILVNNAGTIAATRCSDDNAVEMIRQEMETNLFGAMKLTSELLPLLRQSQEAAIVNVSSIAAICNFPSIGTYSVTKAAMQSYTEGLRADLAGSSIQVVGVYPGPHDTRLAAGTEMDKPAPDNVAVKTFEGLEQGSLDIYPDEFSAQMRSLFREDEAKLAQLFAQMSQ